MLISYFNDNEVELKKVLFKCVWENFLYMVYGCYGRIWMLCEEKIYI